jgi:hypothetical protein
MTHSSRTRSSRHWLHRRLVNATVLILSLTLSFLALEAATRLIYRDVKSTGDRRSYFHVHHARENPPQLNRFGFRERDFPTSALGDTYRIAVIGDSFIEGHGIADADRLTNLLERRLDSSNRELEFEVLNFGIGGSDTADHIDVLDTIVVSASPDFVLLGWYVNDVRNDRDLRWSSLPLIPWRGAHQAALRRSALYYVLDRVWIDIQHRMGLIESEDEFLAHYFADRNGTYARRAEALLHRFIAICRDRKIPLGIVMFPPLRSDQNNQFPLGFLMDRVLQVCAQYQIECVDLRHAFASVEVAALRVNRLDHHPNQRANRLAVETVLDTFEGFWTASARARARNRRAAAAESLGPR